MQIKYIIDLSPITDQFVLLYVGDGEGSPISNEFAMSLFKLRNGNHERGGRDLRAQLSESFFSTQAVERIESLGRDARELSERWTSKELFKGTTEELSHLTAMV